MSRKNDFSRHRPGKLRPKHDVVSQKNTPQAHLGSSLSASKAQTHLAGKFGNLAASSSAEARQVSQPNYQLRQLGRQRWQP